MNLWKMGTGLAVVAALAVTGCRSQSAYRAQYQQPVVVGSAPVAAPCCKTPAAVTQIPPPPPPPAPFGQ